jgi:hypothetical protein
MTRRIHNPGRRHLPGATAKEQRQYEHILQSELDRGASLQTAKRIAAATVRARAKTMNRTRRLVIRNPKTGTATYYDLVIERQAQSTPKGWKYGAITYKKGKGTKQIRPNKFLDLGSGYIYSKVARNRVRNVAMGFYDGSGVFHPIRASSDYDERVAGETGRKPIRTRKKSRVAAKAMAGATARARAKAARRGSKKASKKKTVKKAAKKVTRSASRRPAKAPKRRRRNVAMGFYDGSGVFHPIRASSDYDERVAGETGRKPIRTRKKSRVAAKAMAGATARARAKAARRGSKKKTAKKVTRRTASRRPAKATKKVTRRTSSRRPVKSTKKAARRRNPSYTVEAIPKYSKTVEETITALTRGSAIRKLKRKVPGPKNVYSYRIEKNPRRRGMHGSYASSKKTSRAWGTSTQRAKAAKAYKGAMRRLGRIASGMRRNPSPAEIRRQFAGSVSGERDLYFPHGTPQGLAKLGKLVSITTEEGTIKPVAGTAWLCADTHGKLHLGSTNGAPLYDGPPRDFGEVSKIEYQDVKKHLGYTRPTIFFHHVGEKNHIRPTLHADGEGGLVFRDGDYHITSRGLEN